MLSSMDEITSEPPQPDPSASDPRHCRALSSRLRAYCSFQVGGLPSDHARHLKIRLHPTDEELVETQVGRDPRRPIEERYYSILRRQQLIRTGSLLASRQQAFVVYENAGEYTAINIPEEGEMCVEPARPHRSRGLPGNISGEGTSIMLNHVSGCESPSSEFDGLAYEHSDIEMEGSYVRPLDRTQLVHGGPRWTILGDSLWDVIVQGTFALVGLKTSNASSPVKDVLFRVVVTVYAVGFLSASGGKLIGSTKMGVVGSASAVLGFLLTMVLLLL